MKLKVLYDNYVLQFTNDTLTTTSTVPPPVESLVTSGRHPDDGTWYDFSDAPLLLLYVYSAFVDSRASATGHRNYPLLRLSFCFF